MYQVTFSRTALKSLKKFPLTDRVRIKKVNKKLEQDPFSLDPTNYRIRTGSYRIFLNIDTTSKAIVIVDIERRTTQTYR